MQRVQEHYLQCETLSRAVSEKVSDLEVAFCQLNSITLSISIVYRYDLS